MPGKWCPGLWKIRMTQSRYDVDLICIGSGPAGQRAAIQASKLGKRVAVVEKQRCIGGVCIETGTIPSKTFREAVRRVYSGPGLESTSEFSAQGRPTIEQLVGHVARVIEREIAIVRDALVRNDIEMIHGRAALADPHTVVIESQRGKRTMTDEYILVALGTTPSDPPNTHADGQTVITSDTVLSLEKLPRSMAVVGAGVVGIEYASMFAALDVQVTVIDQRPRPLEFLDAEIVDELIHQMRKSDVTFRCGETVSKIDVVESPQRKALLGLESGKHVAADVILFSAGRVGATQSLNLNGIGIEPDQRGRLKVDDRYRTSGPNIYDAGDVIGY